MLNVLNHVNWYQSFRPMPWYCFPLWPIVNGACPCYTEGCTDIGKHPRLAGWPERSRNLAEMRQWFRAHPDSGIALATGNGLLVVDGDLRNGGLEWVSTQVSYCPKTVSAVTGSGGLHLYYSYDRSLTIGNRTNLVPGVDIRAHRGFVVLPPSPHKSGNRYAWVKGQAPHEHAITPASPLLLSLLTTEPPAPPKSNGTARDLGGLEHWARQGKPEGQRQEGLYWLLKKLNSEHAPGDQAWKIAALYAQSCSPPMDTQELTKHYRRFWR